MTTDGPRIPADLDAETAMLGAMLLSRDAVAVGADMLLPSDFYDPTHAAVFSALLDRHRGGLSADPVGVAAALDEAGTTTRPERGWRGYLLRLQADTPASANAPHYASTIIDRAERRRLLAVADALLANATDLTVPLDDVVQYGRAGVDGTTRTTAARRFPNYVDWSATVDMTEAWVVPGILERKDRAILVAAEGAGKSLLLRQFLFMLACGIHWFSLRRMDAQPVLAIDVENSDRQIVRQTDLRLRSVADRVAPGWDHDMMTVIPFASLDLNSRADRLAVESYIAGHRPSVVSLGPLYKIFTTDARHSLEENALRAQRVIDDWRNRYDCAFLIEHHAPKSREGGILEMRGSAAWMGWPEFGMSLEATDEPGQFRLRQNRGMREARNWPTMMRRDGPTGVRWPWAPVGWEDDQAPILTRYEQAQLDQVRNPYRDAPDEDVF
jgi:replicative DNA helicase